MIKFFVTQNKRKPDIVIAWTTPQEVNNCWVCYEVELDKRDALELIGSLTQQLIDQTPHETSKDTPT